MEKTLKCALVLPMALLLCGCGNAEITNGKEEILSYEGGSITADDLYDKLKELYSEDIILDMIDYALLSEKYETDESENEYIADGIKSAKEQASNYNLELEQYLKYFYGVNSKDAYKETLHIEYKQNLWAKDYAEELVTEKEINDYYENYTVGDMTISHILISADSDDDTESYDKAVEIINKLNNGEDFAALAKEYSEDAATSEEGGILGTLNDGDYDEDVINAAKTLEVGSYSSEPVKSQYGYHIIYKTKQEDKPELDDELKEEIIDIISEETLEDETFITKALKALRDNANLEFNDSDLKEYYNTYLKNNGLE